MMSGQKTQPKDTLLDQTMASLVQFSNAARIAAGAAKEAAQNDLLDRAWMEIDNVRYFIDHPEGILGSHATKHGEIAEVAEVGLHNAWSAFEGVKATAVNATDRFGPVDYLLDGHEVQSKFYNGVRNSLVGVKEHLGKYPDFPQGDSSYSIPKDQHELLQKLLSGEKTGLKQASVDALKRTVKEIEATTGRDFNDVVRPASLEYKEVQLNAIDETLNNKQEELAAENEKRVEEIRVAHEPSWQEGLQATAAAAAVGASAAFVRTTFEKYREGKNIFKGDFTSQDWKEVGLGTAGGAAIGGISGGALYLMTNCANMSAPLAGATVSAVKGLAPLVEGYYAGILTLEELVDTGCMVCAEVSMVAASTAIGQALIPVPVLGALVGSIAGQVLSGIISREVEGSAAAIKARVAEFASKLDAEQKKMLDVMLERFARLGDLTVMAFDVRVNTDILMASAKLARAYRVEDSKLLLSTRDIDSFMLGA